MPFGFDKDQADSPFSYFLSHWKLYYNYM